MRSDYIRFAMARGRADGAAALQTCAGKHDGACDHDHWSAIWWCHRLFDCHRKRVPMARHGLAFLESIRFVDIPVMGVYLVVIAFFLCTGEPDC